MYLLDTNVVAELARNPHGRTAARLSKLAGDEFGINPIVACEIEYGLAKRKSARLRDQLQAILSAIQVFDLPADIAEHYGRIRVELERQGTPIGPYDLLIAAHAKALGFTVVTGNDREFRRVPSLRPDAGLRARWLALMRFRPS
ncbi:MAG: PIN domain-containing protein [Pseudomonadota bacterium]